MSDHDRSGTPPATAGQGSDGPGQLPPRPTLIVTDAEERHRYEARLVENGPLAALISYERSPTWMALLHTEVQEGFEGLGIGTQIVARVIDDARERGLAVVPRCPFVRRWLERHPEQQDVLSHPLSIPEPEGGGRPGEPPEPA
jgi:predicted GNAT family acetyltransferase